MKYRSGDFMKKVLSFILLFVMLFCSVSFLTSCKKNGDDFYYEEEDYDSSVIALDKYDEKYDVNYGELTVKAYYGSSDDYNKVQSVYSDDVFFKPSDEYNHFLARMSMGLALASYTADIGGLEGGDDGLTTFLPRCGFENLRTDEFFQETSKYTVASIIGSKKIEKDGEEATLVVIGIRSGKYFKEWMSNFTVDQHNGLNGGFDSASNLIVDRALSYIAQENITGKVKVWVAGFSRGAAVANLTAAKLNKVTSIGKDNIYAYTFATPRGVAYQSDINEYDNIFNILGPSDPVTQFAPYDWGYGHFGHDIYLPGSEFNSDFTKVYGVVQDEISKFNYKTYYSAALNLRIRLLLGYLTEFSVADSIYSAFNQEEFVTIVGDMSLNNVFRALQNITTRYYDFSDAIDPETFDNLVNYIIGLALPLYTKNNYLADEMGTATSTFRLLMHEHYPEIYYHMMYSFCEDDLFFDNDQFSYVMLDNNSEYELYDGTNLVLSINKKGEKTLSYYAIDNYYDLPVLDFKDTTVLVLPYDRDYELRFSSGKGETTIKYIEYGRDFTSNLLIKEKTFLESSGVVLKVSDGKLESNDFLERNIKSSDLAKELKIDKVGLSWEYKAMVIVAIIVLLLSIIPVLSYLAYVLISKAKFNYKLVINIILLAIISFEDELSYWIFLYSNFLGYLWKILLAIGIILTFIFANKEKVKKIFNSLIPFIALGLASVFLIDKHILWGFGLMGVNVVYLFIYLLRQTGLKTKEVALAVMIAIILEALNIRLIKMYYYLGLMSIVIIPIASLALVMVLNREYKVRLITYLFIISIFLYGVIQSQGFGVISHLLFKASLFTSLICASALDIRFTKSVSDGELQTA